MAARVLWYVFLVLFLSTYANPQGSSNQSTTASANAGKEKEKAAPRSAEQPGPPKDAAEDRERRKAECAECVSVLISRLEPSSRRLYDNERTPAQEERLKEDLKAAGSGKLKAKLWYTAYRDNAQYNIVWSATLIPSTTPPTMDVWATVYEVPSGRKLYQTWHRSGYWEQDHPDEKCLVDALQFLRTRRVTANGVTFTKPAQAYSDDPSYPSPRESR